MEFEATSVTRDELLGELLSSIDEQEIKELNINDTNTQITRSQAEWYTKRYLEIVEKEKEIDRIADEYIESQTCKTNAWREASHEKNKAYLDYIGGLLKEYALNNLTGKSKSVKMISGTLSFRKGGYEAKYDDDKLREYLLENGMETTFLEAVPAKVKHKELKEKGTIIDGYLYINNKIVDGATFTEKPETFSVKC